MLQSERQDEILNILKTVHYTTVEYLVEQVRYSPATIRRDLVALENRGLVVRSRGGVKLNKESGTPFIFRQHSMKTEKLKMAKAAAALVKDGDVVFLDGSTTVQYIGHYLADKQDITVVTNNLLLASHLAAQGIATYCAGGRITELPGTASGMLTELCYSAFSADILFFSTDGMDQNGIITIKPEGYYLHNKAMLRHSKTHVYVCGSDKLGVHSKLIQCDLNEIDYFISDGAVSDAVKEAYPNTHYILVQN